LVGEESAGIRALKCLAESGHRIVGVAASPTPRYGSPVALWRPPRSSVFGPGLRRASNASGFEPAPIPRARAPQRGRVVWSLPAQQVLNFVRACDFSPLSSPWGHAQTRKDKLEIQIVKPREPECWPTQSLVPWVVSTPLDSLWPAATNGFPWGKVRVQEKFMSAAEVLRIGERMETGECL